jgi:hypothetical protein
VTGTEKEWEHTCKKKEAKKKDGGHQNEGGGGGGEKGSKRENQVKKVKGAQGKKRKWVNFLKTNIEFYGKGGWYKIIFEQAQA